MDMLGDTLPQIAGEKAGIIKPGIPVVIGETQESVQAVFQERAKQQQAAIHWADQQYAMKATDEGDGNAQEFAVFRNGSVYLKGLKVAVSGPFLTKNLVTAFQAWESILPTTACLAAIWRQCAIFAAGTGRLRSPNPLSGALATDRPTILIFYAIVPITLQAYSWS